jgi:dihydroorotate dehydrogenase electron transfer subunit
MAVQVKGEVLSIKPVGDYFAMTVVAPGIAQQTRPGQFVAIAIGGTDSAMLLRRAFSIYGVRETGVYGGTVEFIFSVTGKGTAWLARQRAYDPIDVV